jgi:hypothetical protein
MTDVNPYEVLIASLCEEGPVEFQIDRPADPSGDWILDLVVDDWSTTVIWRERAGFGIFSSEPSFGERPSEVFFDAAKAAQRLRQLAARRAQSSGSLPLTLREVRLLAGESQATVAVALQKNQAEISRLEGREDTHLSTLKRYIEALGGEIAITVKFPDFQGPLSLQGLDARPKRRLNYAT